MIVTQITEHTKSKYKIYLDYEFAFVLYKGELRLFGIKEGEELAEETYQKITREVLLKRGKLRSMNLLKSRRYTRRQLEDKLRKGLYPEEVIQQALDYVESYGYINDRQYVTDYIEYHMALKSRNRIRTDLLKKGIPLELTEEIWQDVADVEDDRLEQEQIRNYMRKKKFDPETASVQEKQRFFAFLHRKGFQFDVIRRALLLDIT